MTMFAGLAPMLAGGALSGLGSLFGGGNSLPWSASRAQNELNLGARYPTSGPNGTSVNGDPFAGRFPYSGIESQRQLALGSIDGFDSFLAQLMPQIQGQLDSIFGKSRGLFDGPNGLSGQRSELLGGYDNNINEVRGLLGQATGDLTSAKAAIPALSRERIAQESARLSQGLTARGLHGGTGLEANMVSNILPNVIGDELSAQAQIENQLANLRLGAANTMAGLGTNRFNAANSFLGEDFNKLFNLESSLIPGMQLGTMLPLMMGGAQHRANTLGQPGAIFANPQTKFGVTQGAAGFQSPSNPTSTNLSALFGNFGSSLFNSGMASMLFGGQGGYGNAGSFFNQSSNPFSMMPSF